MAALRPEGPEVSSHARKGVDQVRRIIWSAEGAEQLSGIYGTELMCASIVSHLRRSKGFLWTLIHALTGVAINFRPFGPLLPGILLRPEGQVVSSHALKCVDQVLASS